MLVFEKIYSCLFIPNCTRNYVITYKARRKWLEHSRRREKTLLSFSSRFLRASQQNRAQSTPLYFFKYMFNFLICIEKFVDDRNAPAPVLLFCHCYMSLLTYLNLRIKQYSVNQTGSYKKENKESDNDLSQHSERHVTPHLPCL